MSETMRQLVTALALGCLLLAPGPLAAQALHPVMLMPWTLALGAGGSCADCDPDILKGDLLLAGVIGINFVIIRPVNPIATW